MKTYLKAAASVFAALALVAAGVASAQDSSSSSSSDEPSTDDVLAASIGCIATYDMILAQGKAGADAAKIKDAREFAVSVYKEFSQETDEQVTADIAQADGLFPDMVAKGTTSLEEFRTTCDGVFMDDDSSSSAAPKT